MPTQKCELVTEILNLEDCQLERISFKNFVNKSNNNLFI